MGEYKGKYDLQTEKFGKKHIFPLFFNKSSTEFEGQNQGKTLIPRKIFIPARVGEVCGDVQLRGDQSPLRA